MNEIEFVKVGSRPVESAAHILLTQRHPDTLPALLKDGAISSDARVEGTANNRAMHLQHLKNLLMPMRCAFCGTRSQSFEAYLCAGCLQDLPWRDQLYTEEAAPLSVIAAPLQYAFPVDAALKALKFRGRLDYVPSMAELLCRCFTELPVGIDALLPMPLHWRRLAMRGFNQACELARPVQRKSALPLLQQIRRVRATPFQSGLDAAERSRNLRNAFVATEPITAEHVLIIDDVVTTGESCRRLAKVVLAAGAKKVSALAVART